MKNLTLRCLLSAVVVLTGLQLNAQCDDSCIELSAAVEDYTVQCFEDLEAVSCDASITALTTCNGEDLPIACVTAEQRVATTTCDATTAYGVGEDGALRLYGITDAGLASEYFHPTDAGLTMVQYENDIAILTGQVVCDDNATQIFDVHITFENRVDGADWGGGFKHSALCAPNTDIWDIYTMKDDQSYMTGSGSLAGSYLTLMHAPSSQYFGFQIGEGASNQNCGYGAGGWFAWEGQINGVSAFGSMGDVIVDLDCSEQSNERCSASVDVVYTVLDTTCGILHTFTQTVSRLDDTPPTFDNIPADVTVDCSDALPVVAAVTASDNCIDPESPTVVYIGEFTTAYTAMSCRTLERRWSATDHCGNITLDAQVLTIVDTEHPILTLTIPADIILDVDGDCNVDASTSGLAGDATYTATDNCIMDAGSPVLTHSDAIVDSTSTGCYGIDRTFTLTAQDSCGNSSMESATQHITIQDVEAPVITLNAIETTMSCDDWACDLATLEAAGYVSFSDNCELDGAEITNCIDGSGGCVTPVPTYEVHYQVVDMCGNVTNATQYIELTDDVAPEVSIDCPAQATAYLDANCETDISLAETGEATGSATDNCDDAPEVEVTYEDGDPIYICAGDDDLQLEGSHTILRTFTAAATDHCGNTSSTTCTQLITVLDTISAEMTSITCPDDVTLYLDADCYADTSTEANDYATATAEDNCDAQPSIDITHADATAADCDGGGSYTLTRTFSAEATDDCGNTGASISCDQTITVLDTISPIFDAYDIYVHVSCELIADPTDPTQVPITAQDNCDEDVSYTIEAEFLSGGCPGTWMRTWTAHDNCGNTTTTEQYVEMFDLILPTVTCPEDATVYLTADCTAATSTDDLGLADLSDNCTSSDELYDALVVTDSEQTLTCGDDGTPEGSYTFTRNFATIDYCENENDCTYLITVLDTIAPAAAITDEIVACHDYDADTEFTTITSSDNCDTDIAYTWEQTDLFDQACIGTYKVERTYTFVDDCGNTTVRTQIIQVEDTEAPVAVGDMETTIACHDYSDDDSDEANLLISLSDNCGTITWSFTDITFSFGCVQPNGLFERTYTFSDDCGNTDTFVQFITLVDEVDPTWNEDLPADATEECDNVTPAAVLTASDNCDDDVDITFTETTEGDDDDCPQEYTITRSWLAEDDCNNSISHTQTVTVIDTTSPEFVEALPADATEECDNVSDAATLTATDNCQDVDVSLAIDTVGHDDDCPHNYTITRTWSVEDCAGNSNSHTQTITVDDTTAPTFNEDLPADATEECDAISLAAVLTASDNCDMVDVVFTQTSAEGDCPQEQTITRHWTVSDCAGNTTEHTQTIEVVDTTAPDAPAIACPDDATLLLDDDCWVDSSTAATGEATATTSDNCDDAPSIDITHEDSAPIMSCSATDGEANGSYSFTRTFTATATDACGNVSESTSCTQNIAVNDEIAPEFDASNEFSIACDEYSDEDQYEVAASDNCDGDVTITILSNNEVSGSCAGSILRVYEATDDCGNATEFEQMINLIDTVNPVVTIDMCPGDVTLDADADCNADTSTDAQGMATASATDNCDDAPEVNIEVSDSDPVSVCVGSYSFTRTFTATATDHCDSTHSASCSQLISVQDVTNPTLTEAADQMVECDGSGNTAALGAFLSTHGGAEASDNCSEITWSDDFTALSDDCGETGSVTVTFTASDDCGNTSETSATFTIVDMTAPEITADATTEVSCDLFDMEASYAITASDDCGSVSIEITAQSEVSGECAGSYYRLYTATDACGNTSTFNQTIDLTDDEAPQFNEALPADATEECDAVSAASVLTATDNCDDDLEEEFTTDTDYGDDDCAHTYTITRTWTVTDHCDNATSHTQVVTVVDTQAPAFVEALPGDITEECNAVSAAAVLTASDNCDDVTVQFTETSSDDDDCANDYTLTRVWTVSDCAGNTTSHTQTVTVEDTTDPVFVEALPADATEECSAVSDAVVLTATDNCDAVEVSMDETITGQDDDCANSYTITRVYTVSDCSGNGISHTQVVTVQDTTDPAFVEDLPADATEECNAVSTAATLTATDNCDDVTVVFSETESDDDDCANDYTITRTWTVSDCSGNEISHIQTITVEDTTDPAFVEALPADETVSCESVPAADVLTATDNCDDVTVVLEESNTAGACAQSYTITRTWSTSDCSGNDISHTQVLTVVDDTPPVLTVLYGGEPATDVYVDCADELLEFSFSAIDNCGDVAIIEEFDYDFSDACGNSVTHHHFVATDECQNETEHTFTVTVQDGIAPQFTETCGLSNDESIDICCESHLGEVTIPDACDTEATDNCSDVEIDYTETPIGEFAPTDDVTLFCTTSTPAAHEDGETCNGYTPHSLRLFNFPTEEFFSAGDAGLVEHLVNGDMHITQTVQGIEDPTSGFTIDVTYENGLDFDAWISQSFPTNYKRDCGDLTDDHENWMYYVMSSGSMTGFGDLAGVSLELSHQPANHYFGFQVGVAANNMNNNYGYSGWLMWSGTVDGAELMGSGDLFGDLDCCLPYELERTYVASDCTGNETSFSYTLNVTGEECEDAGSGVSGGAGTGDHNAVVIGGAGNTNKIPISVTNLSPNPTSDYSQLGFMVINDMRVRVDMTTMDGVLVAELFNGLATGDAVHMLDINADQLQSGMYQIRLSSNQYMVVKKLLVTN